MIKLLIFSFLFSLANAQEVVKEAVVIRAKDFNEGVTMSDALDQIYKKIVPRGSATVPLPCIWKLDEEQHFKVLVFLPGDHVKLEIEPILIERVQKPEDGIAYLVNKTEQVTMEGLKESVDMYLNLAKSVDSKPLVQLSRSDAKLSENLDMLRLIRELGLKYIYLSPTKKREPYNIELVPKEGPRPASPHKK